MRSLLTPLLRTALRRIGAPEIPIPLAAPRDADHGDSTSSVALKVAGALGVTARGAAENIVAALAIDERYIASVEIAGNGFINFRFTPLFFQMRLAEILAAGDAWGFAYAGPEAQAPVDAMHEPHSATAQSADDHSPAGALRHDPLHPAQIAHAQIAGILRHAVRENLLPAAGTSLTPLVATEELVLARHLLLLPDRIERAAVHHERQQLADYLNEIAGAFNTFHNACRILAEPPAIRDARLRLLMATAVTLNNGMRFLGVVAAERV